MSAKKKKNASRKHAGHHAALGVDTEEFQAMIHTAIAPDKVEFIPKGKAAVEHEWKKLMDLKAFSLAAMMEQDDVIKMYEAQNKPARKAQ